MRTEKREEKKTEERDAASWSAGGREKRDRKDTG